ncbi:DUF4391 domain-containing protein [Streptomyces fradiae]|uniref:DUF4391 domain-containing protein n=1 Tax=Streptomyces fradiae TaxID=1906 RepID=UPI002943786D|nr:DUF4391 domain-containing protein [Streptomyces fradiae]WOI63224.1 DUF4391 domain-containing protein [Streptomyces fradiae]
MIPEDVVDALRLPADCAVNVRVPKTQLQAHTGFSAADRRLLQDGIDTLHWAAAIRPDAVGIPACTAPDGSRRIPELHVMTLQVRTGAKLTRLEELLHRAVPYPILLVSEQPSGPRVSVALKRMSYTRNGDVTLDTPPVTASVGDAPVPASDAFLSSLQLDRQPRNDLGTVYEGWLTCTVALRVASVTGEFMLASTLDAARDQLTGLTESSRLEVEISKLLTQIRKEKQIPSRIELQEQIKAKKTALSVAHDTLRST